jgi:spoIIIJ-associated protein
LYDGEAEMDERRANLEIIAPSVDEAIEKGLSELGLPQSSVDVEILDSGSKGLFGLGNRQARIRLTIKAGATSEISASFRSEGGAGEPQIKVPQAVETGEINEIPVVSGTSTPFDSESEQMERVRGDQDEWIEEEEQSDRILQIAQETVQELIEKMKIKARLTVRYGEPEDPKDRVPLLVDIRGDDLSILIGPKAETLNALQYIVALIIGKEIGHSVPLVVDVEGYRARRSQQIRQLARRMAEQAVRTGRRQVLEPMPAGERRLVHIELRENPEVTTESIGEEPRRKVTIIPR